MILFYKCFSVHVINCISSWLLGSMAFIGQFCLFLYLSLLIFCHCICLSKWYWNAPTVIQGLNFLGWYWSFSKVVEQNNNAPATILDNEKKLLYTLRLQKKQRAGHGGKNWFDHLKSDQLKQITPWVHVASSCKFSRRITNLPPMGLLF
jgi:hypothetical protein